MITEAREKQEIKPSAYDLHLFKMLIEKSKSGLQYKPYTSNKLKVYAYKGIFFAISLFFVLVSLHLYTTNISWTAQFIFGSSGNARFFFCALSFLLGIFSCYTALKIVPHRELASSIIRNAKRKANRLYRKKLFFLSYQRIIEASEIKDAETCWRFALDDVQEEFDELLSKSHLLLDRISISRRLSQSEKEKLFNEALVELQTELSNILKNFSEGKVKR